MKVQLDDLVTHIFEMQTFYYFLLSYMQAYLFQSCQIKRYLADIIQTLSSQHSRVITYHDRVHREAIIKLCVRAAIEPINSIFSRRLCKSLETLPSTIKNKSFLKMWRCFAANAGNDRDRVEKNECGKHMFCLIR